jgi:two-component system LytT family response regulator
VKTHGKLLLFKVDDVDWVESAGDYVNIHVRGEQHLLRETMAEVEAKLDPARFMRIHRSTIVNVDRVKELELLFQGQYLVRLRDGTRLTASRSYKKQIDQLLARAL